ncbi:GumC family protein [Amniculibacterium sp. G2-70]|uniref:GumC family protein n=1 Tax=Amniculibacterium sp. G2-70 TaxID=2767188 RepID=UPI001653F870|nr:tyrosine-protein kinase family protein [Amniculibacterium sp. G2-70]
MDNQNFSQYNTEQEEETINLRELLEKYIAYWKWFLLSIFLCLSLAFLYLRYATKQYNVSAQILLKDKDAASPELEAIKDAVSFGSKDNAMVTDQSKILKSRRLMTKVVEKNELNVQYINKGRINTSEVSKSESPVVFSFQNPNVFHDEKLKGSLFLKLSKEGYEILDKSFVQEGEYSYGTPVKSDFGLFVINKNPKKFSGSQSFEIHFQSINFAADKLRNQLQVEAEKDGKSKVVNLSLISNDVKKAEGTINTLIDVYNTDLQEDKNVISKATADFINNRLKIISNDLSGVDKSMESFKTSNKINDLQAEGGLYMNNAFQVDKDVVSLTAQLQIANQMMSNLNRSKDVLLPANVGLEDVSLNSGIESYNQLVLEKQDLSKSMKDANPVMQALNENIRDVKSSVKNNLRLFQNTLQTKLSAVESKKGELTSKLNKMPQQELGFKKIARQQQIVEAIYLFLLEKREEAEIKASAKVDAIKIVDLAYSNGIPVSPKKNIIYLGAFILGLVIPVSILYLLFMLDNKVKSRLDIKKIYKGPILGDIPLAEVPNYVISNNDHSSVAESFRILRGNLQFMMPQVEGCKTILLTSTIPGEGKTFASINLAQIISLSKKKVLLIGADLRSPKLLAYMDLDSYKSQIGLSNLLADEHLDPSQTIIKNTKGYGFDILHSGSIPPNPAELLMTDRLEQLINQWKTQYDYIILDAPPVSLVGDAQIIAKHTDMTLYMTRVNHMDKRMLSVLEEAYESQKMKNLAVIINGIDYTKGYGYGYGYGHLHEKNKKKGFLGLW